MEKETVGQVENRSGILRADDLEVGKWIMMHSLRGKKRATCPIFGVPFRIEAIQLPFILAIDSQGQKNMLDFRFCNFMACHDTWVRANNS